MAGSFSEKTYSTKANEFWQFSCDFYRAKGVKECLLDLQDNCQLNVNEILLCIWLAFVEKQAFTENKGIELIKSCQQSKNWVERQRELRKEITSASNSHLKEELLKLELNLEKIHQSSLVDGYLSLNLLPASKNSAEEIFRQNLSLIYKQQNWLNGYENLIGLVRSYFSCSKS
ncbi:MAG: TIGR02444 family protein [Kangiellaceae bacterium]|nr:TIGR02444 family protein [Kangiellaceae bacterium]MCW9001023.1 TIGR02444 family protein [Kangiellaceae bacterium]MCW9017757.1 TIGR02444 family protein [Kangiellaceae bacterium]